MSLLKAYERIERHRVARTSSPDEPVPRTEQSSQTAGGPGVESDPLADLLTCPIRNLPAPLAVASSVLVDTIYLVANEAQAASVRARGGVPYTPEEIDILWGLHETASPEAWRMNLRLIHETKRRFAGSIVPECEEL